MSKKQQAATQARPRDANGHFLKGDVVPPVMPEMNQRAPKEPPPQESFATFVTLAGVGKSHAILLKRTEEEWIQEPGQDAPRRVPKRDSAVVIRFVEGVYTTADPVIIESLLEDPKARFGLDIDINRHDPTRYWRLRGDFKFTVQENVEITGPRIGHGPVTQRLATV